MLQSWRKPQLKLYYVPLDKVFLFSIQGDTIHHFHPLKILDNRLYYFLKVSLLMRHNYSILIQHYVSFKEMENSRS